MQEPETLPELYVSLHHDMVTSRKWTTFSNHVFNVDWDPWKIWGAIGYTDMKMQQLISQSIDPFALQQCAARLRRVESLSKSSDVYTVSLHFGRHTAGKVISPLRYKLGECISMVIFKVHKGKHYRPTVIWRTTEITRRMIADWVMLDNLWRWLAVKPGKVRMLFGSFWLANFNLQIFGRLCPDMIPMASSSWARLMRPKAVPPKYNARRIAWGVAQKIRRPMFNWLEELYTFDLRPGTFDKSDFPILKVPDGNSAKTKS